MTTREICISEHLTFLTKIIYITFQKTLPVWNIWRRTQKRCFQSTSLRPCYRTAWTDASSTSTTSVSASGPLGGGSEAPLHPCPLLEIPVQKGISTRVKKTPHIKRQSWSSPGQGLSSLLHASYCLRWQNHKSSTAVPKSYHCSVFPLSNSYTEEPSNK